MKVAIPAYSWKRDELIQNLQRSGDIRHAIKFPLVVEDKLRDFAAERKRVSNQLSEFDFQGDLPLDPRRRAVIGCARERSTYETVFGDHGLSLHNLEGMS